MLKICSWDIGVKNLAYCIMSKNEADNALIPYPIYNWSIINLIETPISNCHCGKPAKYIYHDQKYCGTHIDFPIKTCHCHKKAIYVNNGIYYCEKHLKLLDNVCYYNFNKELQCATCSNYSEYYSDKTICHNCCKSSTLVKHVDYNMFYENNRTSIKCKVCQKKAKYTSNEGSYCTSHKKLYDIEHDIDFIDCSKDSIQNNQKCITCNKKGLYIKNNATYCNKHKNEEVINIQNQNIIKSITNKKK